MRQPIFRVTNDDDPMDPDFPLALSLAQLWDTNAVIAHTLPEAFPVGGSITVGGGAATQFTIERIR